MTRATGRDPAPRDKQVTFVIRSLHIGGAERQLVELASGLQRGGWRVAVLAFYPGGALRPELEQRGILVQDLRKRGRWDVVPFAIRLVRRLRDLDAPVVHGYLGEANMMIAALKPLLRGSRVVWGIRSSNLDAARHDWLSSVMSRVNRVLAGRADLIICNSVAGKQSFAALGYPGDRMVVVPNGIDAVRFAPNAAMRTAIRGEWSIGEDELLIGLVGRLDPIKGHATLLRAVASLEQPSHVRLVCVGTGPAEYQAEMQALAAELGLDERVLWSGPRTDMPAVYNGLDLLVSASAGEGFPNAVAEAMSSGIPCVVTDVGDSATLVGTTGWVCPPADAQALSGAIALALASLEVLRSRGREARQRILDDFDTDRLTTVTADLLESVAARS